MRGLREDTAKAAPESFTESFEPIEILSEKDVFISAA